MTRFDQHWHDFEHICSEPDHQWPEYGEFGPPGEGERSSFWKVTWGTWCVIIDISLVSRRHGSGPKSDPRRPRRVAAFRPPPRRGPPPRHLRPSPFSRRLCPSSRRLLLPHDDVPINCGLRILGGPVFAPWGASCVSGGLCREDNWNGCGSLSCSCAGYLDRACARLRGRLVGRSRDRGDPTHYVRLCKGLGGLEGNTGGMVPPANRVGAAGGARSSASSLECANRRWSLDGSRSGLFADVDE